MLAKQKKILAKFLEPHFGISKEKIEDLLELPRDKTHGDLALPCFIRAKELKKNPAIVAQELKDQIQNQLPREIENVSVVSGFLNFHFTKSLYFESVLKTILKEKENYGQNLSAFQGKTAVVDFSSPNVAKPMSIGHLRSTVIGQSVVRLLRAQGYKVVGINYLGDWGVQFGKLAWAHLNKKELLRISREKTKEVLDSGFNKDLWDKLTRDVESLPDDSFDYLYALYVVFHALAELDEKLEDYGRQTFVALETRQSPEVEKLWRKFVDVSLQEYNRVYQLLGVQFDHISGESHFEKDLPQVVKDLEEKGLLVLSQGAQVVDLEEFGMPPCLIQKSDGATLYATRDIAAARHRHDHYKADRLIYVVGAEQNLHFKQVFKVLELMNYSWASQCQHVGFGLYRFKEGKMSTRRGNVVFLEDVLDRAIELVSDIIKEKNPDLKNPQEVARQVGTGAVVFNDLMNDRVKNIDFDWDRLLDFNGDTGPYVQYTNVRCASILKKWAKPLPTEFDPAALKEKLEWEIVSLLGRFDQVLKLAYDGLKPNIVAHYLLELAKTFNSFYYEHRILEGPANVTHARILLVTATGQVIRNGLYILGISAPEAM